MEDFTPKQIVEELDKYIVGQDKAKRSVAIALRNRYRRRLLGEDMREEVFKPFLRLDAARNQDNAGTGLGLAIARDIARGHGGDIVLQESPLGGLRARVMVPA